MVQTKRPLVAAAVMLCVFAGCGRKQPMKEAPAAPTPQAAAPNAPSPEPVAQLPEPMPGQTGADLKLQARILRYIGIVQKGYARDCPYQVVDTKRIKTEENGVVHEEWTVDSCGQPVVYPITLTPIAGDNGFDVAIGHPDAFGKLKP